MVQRVTFGHVPRALFWVLTPWSLEASGKIPVPRGGAWPLGLALERVRTPELRVSKKVREKKKLAEAEIYSHALKELSVTMSHQATLFYM